MSAAAPVAALLDAGMVARFGHGLAAALGREPTQAEPIALAVSGGADSMAMLVLALAAFPGRVIAATVDHGLRAEAAAEAAMVARWCAHANVPHAILSPAEPIALANLQAGARAARYRLLAAWARRSGAGWIATAHHADDQAETFLMRAARGSGVAGLAGVRPRQRVTVDDQTIDLVRPLLGWRAAELRALATALSLPFVDDPSNADDRFDRTKFRALLCDHALLDAAMISRSAAYVAEAEAAITEIEAWLWRTRQMDALDGECALDMADLPRELRRRLSRAAIDHVRRGCGIDHPHFIAGANIEPLLNALEMGRAATHAGVMATPEGMIWRFCKAPPRRSH